MAKEVKKNKIELKEYVEFRFAYENNLQNVAVSLAKSGYYINIRQENGVFILKVYSTNFNH